MILGRGKQMRNQRKPRRHNWSGTIALLTVLGLTACGGGSGSVSQLSQAEQAGLTPTIVERPEVSQELDEALSLIGEATLDSSIDLGLAEQLRETLAQELLNTGLNRFTTAAPSVESSYVPDFSLQAAPDGSVTFSWSYINRGDYDQNSEVNIADLSVLGTFWQSRSTDTNWAKASVADGDENGEINAADIVPIASNYLNTFSSYVISGSLTPEDPESWTEIAVVPVSSGEPGTENSIPHYAYQLVEAVSGMSFALNPQGVGQPGECSPLILFGLTGAEIAPAPLTSQGNVEGRVEISWEAQADALTYWLQRSDSAEGEYENIFSTSGDKLSFNDYNVVTGSRYWYRTLYITGTGYAPPSLAAEGWPLEDPQAPENVGASDGSSPDHVTVSWDLVFSAEAYQISRSDTEEGNYQALGTTQQTQYQDTTGEWGIAYFYRVQATSSAGVSAPSAADSGYRGVLGQPPVILTVSPLNRVEGTYAKFSATFSGNAPESYLWNFNGAGNTSTQSSPTILLGAPGTYACTLTVANQWGGDVFDFTLNINPQNSSISGVNPESGVEGTEVTFIVSYGGVSPTSYAWDFGGGASPGNSIEPSPTVTLGVPGDYSASVSVTGAGGTENYFFTLSVLEGVPLITEVSPLSGDAGDVLNMLATNLGGAIDTWDWNFGSAATPSTSSAVSPAITLGTSGNYPCSVTATNAKGNHTFNFTLSVLPPPPFLTNVSPATGVAGSSLSPTASNTGGQASSWAWYFGGGATPNSSALPTPTVTLGAVGIYNCSVVATNINGSVIFPFTLTITAPPPDITAVAPKSGVSGAVIQPVPTNAGGPVESWTWNFGGGALPNTSNDASPQITLGAPGSYNASVIAQTGGEISQRLFTLTVSVAPPEILNVIPDSGLSGGTVEFIPSMSGGSVANWQWSFGGGATPNSSTDPSPEVVLGAAGSYTVTLVASNTGGTDTYNLGLTVNVALPNITAVNPKTGVTGTSLSPVPTNSGGAIANWQWNFAGGATPNLPTDAAPTVTLGAPGAYQAQVEGYNISGSSARAFLLEVATAAPTGLSASDGSSNSHVALNWSAATGADRYIVERSTTENGTYTSIATNVTTTSYNDTSASAGSTLWYRVKAAVDPVGHSAIISAPSNNDSGWRSTAAPTGVDATDGDFMNKVGISWNSVSGASSYTVLRATSSGGTYSSIGTPSATNFDDTTASIGVTYYYKVRSESAAGSGGTSTDDSGWRKTAAPTGVDASDGSFTDKVQITWNSVTGATSYTVLRATSAAGSYSSIGTPSSTSFDDTTASIGTTYYYKVRSESAAGSGDMSTNDSGWRKTAAPTGLVASDGTYPNKVGLNWDSVSGATSYTILRSTSAGGTYTSIGTSNNENYEDTTVTVSTYYYYKVRSESAPGSGDTSANDSGYAGATPS
jgi:PKD repeat protein